MKSKILSAILIFFVFILASCTKETFSNINGQWVSVAVYTKQQNGSYRWVKTDKFPHFYQFSSDTRFVSYTDAPGGYGTYSYDSRSGELTLAYEADQYGNTPQTAIFKVEQLNKKQLVISYYSPAGNFVYKTEYSKID